MLSKGVTLRGLEVFEALARSGTVAQAASLTGMSQPAVSQQLRNLEAALGADLIDHSKRPMRLTPAGEAFLLRAEAALSQLRLAQSELTVMDLAHISALNIGIIDDFDDNLTPRIATILADNLTGCRFRMVSASSNDIRDAMREKRLHLGIAARSGQTFDGVIEYPIARDPFMLVAPRGVKPGLLDETTTLPYLRYDQGQLIRQQIDTYLNQSGVALDDRFEIGSHLALMAMVARGIGWTITTPLGFMRAARFHDQVDAFAMPDRPHARQISLFANADWAGDVPKDLARTFRQLIRTQMLEPALAQYPWLNGEFRILET